MDAFTKREKAQFRRAFYKHEGDNPLRLVWYGQTEEDKVREYAELANLVPKHAKISG